jgi:tight adherence protein B
MIVLWAVLVGALCWTFLYFRDRRMRKEHVDRNEVQGDKPMISGSLPEDPHFVSIPSYRTYQLQVWERALVIAGAGVIAFLLGYIFYRSIVLALLLATAALWSPRLYMQRRIRLRKELLVYQFKQALYSISTSLAAGRSVDNAFRAAAEDMKAMYADSSSNIVLELNLIIRRIDHGDTLEHAFTEFAQRTDSDDIIQFAEMLVTCKRTGGDLVEAVRRTSQIMSEKIEIQQEIAVMVARKRFEAHALGVIPPLIVAMLSFGSPEYMAPLYSGGGRAIMTAALVMFIGCYFMMRRMTDIKL